MGGRGAWGAGRRPGGWGVTGLLAEVAWLVHNLVAHPLLGVASTAHRAAVWLHDATTPSIDREAADLELVR